MATMALSSSNNSLFDEVRKIWVAATPEEIVRQKVLKKLIHGLGFPKELIAVEKELKELPHIDRGALPQRRVDILCYGKQIHPLHPLYPLLLIECKKEKMDEAAAEQAIGYNAHVRAYFIALADRQTERFGYLDKMTKQYVFHNGLPSFKDLMSWLKQSI
jgi:Type I restriction enzyme R protein N terminus (HSDR_N)